MTVLCVWEMSIAVQFVDETFQSLRTARGMSEKSISDWTKSVVHIVK